MMKIIHSKLPSVWEEGELLVPATEAEGEPHQVPQGELIFLSFLTLMIYFLFRQNKTYFLAIEG